jgi:hypothetical protein
MQGTSLRITPPLNVGVAEIDEFVGRLDRALGRLERNC